MCTRNYFVCYVLLLCNFTGIMLAEDPAIPLPEVVAGPIVNPANGHLYYLLEQSTWTDAEAKAVEMGGHLVTINNQEENDWVYNTFLPFAGLPGEKSQGDLWIGYTDAENEGVWEWISGEASDFVNWTSVEPNGGTKENYGMIWGPYWHNPPYNLLADIPGQWNDLGNWDTFAYHVTPWGVVEIIPLTVTTPNGGETLSVQEGVKIEWTSTGYSKYVTLAYSTDLGVTWQPICTIPNTHSYEWIPTTAISDTVLIRINDHDNSTISDVSDNPFSMFECQKLLLGDINRDCYVDLRDFALIASEWLICSNPLDPSCGVSEVYIHNGSFESKVQLASGFPKDIGYWGGDLHAIVGETQGIVPFHGSKMLQFLGSFENLLYYPPHSNRGNATGSDIEQCIMVSPSDVVGGNTKIVVTAQFNRVHKDDQTDTKFAIEIVAYSVPNSLALKSIVKEIICDPDPATWEELSAELLLPINTDLISYRLVARENVYNDMILYDEFDGHFADGVTVTLVH